MAGIPQFTGGHKYFATSVPRADARPSSLCRRDARVLLPAALTVTTACAASLGAAPASTTVPTPTQQLPGGGYVLFPDRRLVAIYGHPGDHHLGALGEQRVDSAVQRAREVAGAYNGVSPQQVIPTFEIITTVASSEAGPDGDYSLESSLDHIRPWVDAARAAGFYVVLDLQ